MTTGLFPSDPIEALAFFNRPREPQKVETAAEFAKRCKTDPTLSALIERQERLAREEQRVRLANILNSIIAEDLAYEMKQAHGTDSTRACYRTDFRRFQRYCVANGYSALPAAPETLAFFLLEMAKEGVQLQALKRMIAAVKYYHSQSDTPFHDGIEVRAVLRFISRCAEQQKEIDARAATVAQLEKSSGVQTNGKANEEAHS